MPNEKAAEPLSEEKLADKTLAGWEALPPGATLIISEVLPLIREVRAARAILTPEVLRLIEAGRALQEAARREDEAKRRVRAGPQDKASLAAMYKATEDVGGALGHLCGAALALPFEKPAECNHTEKQQLPKKGGEP